MIKMISPTPLLGYGMDAESLEATRVDIGLDAVGCDAGSTDPGPYYLGTGKVLSPPAAVKRDLGASLEIARANSAPCVIGSTGGSGTDSQLAETKAILDELLAERGWAAKVAIIHSEVEPAVVADAVDDGRLTALDGFPALTRDEAQGATRIVAMMGAEPFIEALNAGADVVLAGRSSDAAIFAALGIRQGMDPGAAWCTGKLLECAAACADPFGLDSMIADCDEAAFTVYPPNERRRCTNASVSAMFLHENADPFSHQEPSGRLDLSGMELTELPDQRGVRVEGARFVPSERYTVRLEGVTRRGHRTVQVAATRDPRLIATLDGYLADAEATCRSLLAGSGVSPDQYRLGMHVYGRDGVLGPQEFARPAVPPHEVAVVLETIGESPEISRTVAAAIRSSVLHRDFPGRQCTEGNFAFPFSPCELDGGESYEFTVWHALALSDPLELFPIDYYETEGGEAWPTR